MVEKRILESVIPCILLSQLRYCVEMFFFQISETNAFQHEDLFLNVKKKKNLTGHS